MEATADVLLFLAAQINFEYACAGMELKMTLFLSTIMIITWYLIWNNRLSLPLSLSLSLTLAYTYIYTVNFINPQKVGIFVFRGFYLIAFSIM